MFGNISRFILPDITVNVNLRIKRKVDYDYREPRKRSLLWNVYYIKADSYLIEAERNRWDVNDTLLGNARLLKSSCFFNMKLKNNFASFIEKILPNEKQFRLDTNWLISIFQHHLNISLNFSVYFIFLTLTWNLKLETWSWIVKCVLAKIILLRVDRKMLKVKLLLDKLSNHIIFFFVTHPSHSDLDFSRCYCRIILVFFRSLLRENNIHHCNRIFQQKIAFSLTISIIQQGHSKSGYVIHHRGGNCSDSAKCNSIHGTWGQVLPVYGNFANRVAISKGK